MESSSKALRELAVSTLGPPVFGKVIPRLAADTGFAKATVRSYLYSKPPSQGFCKKVRDLYGWDLDNPDNPALSRVPPVRDVSPRVKRITSKASRVKSRVGAGEGFQAAVLFNHLVGALHDLLLRMGYLVECTSHSNFTAVFTVGREKLLEAVLRVSKSQVKLMVYSGGDKIDAYSLFNSADVSRMAEFLWNTPQPKAGV